MSVCRIGLCLVGIVLVCSVAARAQESDPQTPAPTPQRSRPEPEPRPTPPQRRENLAARRAALARLAMTGTLAPTRVEDTGPDLEVVRRNAAWEDLLELANGLQALYDLGAQTERDADFIREVDDGAEKSAGAVRRVLEFINRDADPPEREAIELGNETFDERVLRLASIYLSILEPIAGLIGGDTLNLNHLAQARSGLAEIEALTLSLPDLVR